VSLGTIIKYLTPEFNGRKALTTESTGNNFLKGLRPLGVSKGLLGLTIPFKFV
jgi:hypothetical protein